MGGVQQPDEVGLAEPFRLAFTPLVEQRAVDQPAALPGPAATQPGHRHPHGAFAVTFTTGVIPRGAQVVALCALGRVS